jgi:hypothetical protein
MGKQSGNLPDIPVDSIIVNQTMPSRSLPAATGAFTIPMTYGSISNLAAFRERHPARDGMGHANRSRSGTLCGRVAAVHTFIRYPAVGRGPTPTATYSNSNTYCNHYGNSNCDSNSYAYTHSYANRNS